MEITYCGESQRVAPTRMIASNRSLIRSMETFIETRGISFEELFDCGGVCAFSADQFLLLGADSDEPVRLTRGTTLVETQAAQNAVTITVSTAVAISFASGSACVGVKFAKNGRFPNKIRDSAQNQQ